MTKMGMDNQTMEKKSVSISHSPYYEVVQGSTSYPALETDGQVNIANAVTIRLADDVPDQVMVPIVLRFTEGNRTHDHIISIVANAPKISINPNFQYSYSGFPSTHIQAEGTTMITFSVQNTGHATSHPLQAHMTLKAPFVTVKPSQQTQSGLEPGRQTSLTLTAIAKENEITNTWLQSHTAIQYGAYLSTLDTIVQYGCVFEGFETDTPSIQLSNHSASPWEYDDTDAFDGERCFKVSNITGTTTLILGTPGDIDFPSTISFFYKNKTADTLDLTYRDPISNYLTTTPLVGNDAWQYMEIPVKEGKQAVFTLKIKDPNGTGNYAKIDNICFPSRCNPVAYAGDTLISCGNTPIEITTAYAYHCQSVSWTTSGDGTFENANNAITTYIPGNQDIINGTATLTLRAINNDVTHTHSTPLILGDIPTSYIAGDLQVNLSANPVSHYSVPAINGASYQWSILPANAGDILEEGNEALITWNTTEEIPLVILSVTIENECASKTIRKNLLLSGYSIPEWEASTPAVVYLYNILGELICTFNTTHSDIDHIDIPRDIHLPSSIYILKLNTPNGSISKKILIP